LNIFLSFILIFNFLCLPVLAQNFDVSIDDEIRRNYNPEKIDKDLALPDLPLIHEENNSKPKQFFQAKAQKQNNSELKQEAYAVIKKGTKFKVKLLTNISDKTPIGNKVSFISQYPVTTTYYTIPAGTIFQGEVIQSHEPQLSANGGLIVLNINALIVNNKIHPINAYVAKAKSKHIFFNKIKGKRKYVSSMFNSMKPGANILTKMLEKTNNLIQKSPKILLSPLPLTLGLVCMTGNILISPAIALFYKGNFISIPQGSILEIKLSQDVFIR
jgi:hypothetical protein